MAAYTEILRSLREDHDMTQAQAAVALGPPSRCMPGMKRA